MSIVRCLSLVALGVAASATAHAQSPAPWCTEETTRLRWFGSIDDGEDVMDLYNVAAGSCGNAQAHERPANIAELRAKWNQRLGMVDADWRDVAEWATRSQVDRNSPSFPYNERQPWSSYDPIDQYASFASGQIEPMYLADALGSKLTEAGRLGYIQRCIAMTEASAYAVCQPDIDALDPKRLADEIRSATKKSGYARMSVRLAAFTLKSKLAAHQKKVQALLASDPGYAKVFAAAAAARTQFSADPKLLELALEMDSARVSRSNRLLDGCMDKVWPAFAAALAKVPAKKFEGVKHSLEGPVNVIVNSAETYLAAVALYGCAGADKPDPIVRYLGAGMQRWSGYRGPRSAAFTALRTLEPGFDDRDRKLDFPDLRRGWFGSGGTVRGGATGKVAGAKRTGDTLVIDFERKAGTRPVCTSYKYTNKLVAIRPDGQLVYDYICLKYGTEKYVEGPDPQTVKALYAGGIKKGVTAYVVEDAVTLVIPKGTSTVPTHVFGVAVK